MILAYFSVSPAGVIEIGLAYKEPEMFMACELCETSGGEVLWESPECRVVSVGDLEYPGYCRVIWKNHVREMSDLSEAERARIMRIVFTVEEGLRTLLHPDKINLASLGNMTPHLHWHVIPRFESDPHFPASIWSERVRDIQREAPANLSSRFQSFLSEHLAFIDESG